MEKDCHWKRLSLEMLRKANNVLKEQRIKEPYYLIHPQGEVQLLLDTLMAFEPISFLPDDKVPYE